MDKSLLISEIFPPTHGGSGRWFWELYSRLPREGYIIAAGHSKEAERFDQNHDLNIERLDLSSTSWGIKCITGLKYYWKTFTALKKINKTYNIKTIHCGRCLPEGVFGYLFFKLYSIPYLCYIHGEDVETASSSRELSFIVNKVLNNAGVLICNSNNTRQILLDNWNTNPEKTLTLNPGVDSEKFIPAEYNQSVRNKLAWADRPVILTVGRLQQRKGQDMLIKALPELIKSFPDILYAIVGDGDEKPVLEELVQQLELQGHVMFMSEISDLEMIQCYQQCTIFALPNRTIEKDIEGFGMVLVEAQSCEKPVIAGDSGGTAETMIIGETGYIVDCTNPEPVAIKLTELLNDNEKINTMGKKARIHAVETLDWKTHTIKARKIFELIPDQ